MVSQQRSRSKSVTQVKEWWENGTVLGNKYIISIFHKCAEKYREDNMDTIPVFGAILSDRLD